MLIHEDCLYCIVENTRISQLYAIFRWMKKKNKKSSDEAINPRYEKGFPQLIHSSDIMIE